MKYRKKRIEGREKNRDREKTLWKSGRGGRRRKKYRHLEKPEETIKVEVELKENREKGK